MKYKHETVIKATAEEDPSKKPFGTKSLEASKKVFENLSEEEKNAIFDTANTWSKEGYPEDQQIK